MKKIFRSILSVMMIASVILGAFTGCKKDEPAPAQPETTAADSVEQAEKTSAPEKELKAEDINKLNIEYSGQSYYLYSKGGIDFCSVFNEDGAQKFCAVSDKGVKVLSDQFCDSVFVILKNKIYYNVIDETKEYTDKNGADFTFRKQSCWVMNIDGTDKKKLFDYDGVEGYPIYSDGDNFYYGTTKSLDDRLNCVSGFEGLGNFYRYSMKENKSHLIFEDFDGNYCYSNGYLFFSSFSTYFEDCYLQRYNFAADKLEELDHLSVSIFSVGKDTVYFSDYKGCEKTGIPRTAKYTVSKDSVEYIDLENDNVMFENYASDGTAMLADDSNDSIEYYSLNENGELTKLNFTVDSNNDNIQNVFFENEESCFYSIATENDKECRFKIYNSKNGTAAEIAESEKFENTYDPELNPDGYVYSIVGLGCHTAIVAPSKPESNVPDYTVYTFSF